MVEVQQADIEAANSYLSPAKERTVDGLIQAFARHRQAGVQQAFAERDGEDRMALQIIANPDWTWATVAEMREIARQALAAKGDSRG